MDFTADNKTINLQIAREYKSLLKISYQTLSEDDKLLIRKEESGESMMEQNLTR